MSLLSPSSSVLYIAPDRVLALREPRRGAGEMSYERRLPAESVGDIGALLEIVGEHLVKLDTRQVRVLVSDHWLRYATVPWPAGLRTQDELYELARGVFEDVYGSTGAEAWALRLSDEPPGMSRLLSAMPHALREGLRTVAIASNTRLVSLRPQLAAAIAGFGRLPASGWVVNHEEGRLSLASWDRRGWQWVSSVRAELASPQDLTQRLLRELTLAGAWPLNEGARVPILLCAPVWSHHDWNRTEGLDVRAWKWRRRIQGNATNQALSPVRVGIER